ncbi:biotin/lipoyl-binding protein [Comamonas sp. wu1-DMT]|uniref:biotin/lipoyl-binding protein n=1 Tax=Comamonas sp. wu1-DMT TaxID=3126390 RepID=UPI0032E472C7
MTERSALFRSEAVKKYSKNREGSIQLSQARYTPQLIFISLTIIFPVVLFLIFGEYTKRTNISGYVVPDGGIVKIIPSQPGTIAEIFVNDGDYVKKGQDLFAIRDERRVENSTSLSVDSILKNNIENKRSSIIENISLNESHLNKINKDYAEKKSKHSAPNKLN